MNKIATERVLQRVIPQLQALRDSATALEESFAHVRRILEESDPMSVGAEVSLFGRESTVQKTWILTATHLHEHLGQMIAYARSNDVVPPWTAARGE